jgi:biotin carboxyl carrier protein
VLQAIGNGTIVGEGITYEKQEPTSMKYLTTIADKEYLIEIIDENRILLNSKEFVVDFDALSEQPVYSLLVDGKSFEAFVYPSDEFWNVLMRGQFYPVKVEDERERRLRLAGGSSVSPGTEFHLKAPMPGLVVDVVVVEGQEVEKGDVLLILESMKMQNELKSPRPGIVSRILVENGDNVEQHQTMISVV